MLSGLATFSGSTLSTSTSTSSPDSTRQSRLRGLVYLRNYTGGHLNSQSPTTEEQDHNLVFTPNRTQPARRRRSLVAEVSSSTIHNRAESSLSHPPHLTDPLALSLSGASEAPVDCWLPTVNDTPCRARTTAQVQQASPGPLERTTLVQSHRRVKADMTRHRSVTTPTAPLLPSLTQAATLGTSSRSHAPLHSGSSRNRPSAARTVSTGIVSNPTTAEAIRQPQLPISQLPSIRFVPYNDPRGARPSLAFPTITRTLPSPSSTIKVGRYSEKESAPADLTANSISDAPVGFKSKVVSRRHCEFFCIDNQWHIKDVKSSSGTFLNHIRLSPPGEESKPFAIKDGDLIQLGIDFKGGEEMIFRCVKIRMLCNRGWQKSVNKFNKLQHKHLNDLHRGTNKEFKESTECTICLNSIAPCQSLFVAPCSHTWHYKCIRPMLEEASRAPSAFTQFLCPNCRALADLDADVEEGSIWEDDFSDAYSEKDQSQPGLTATADEEIPLISHDEGLSADLDSLSLQDHSQHPSFGLPPLSTSVSREGSLRGLNPSASSFVPVSSSTLPLPSNPPVPPASSQTGPPIMPSLSPGRAVRSAPPAAQTVLPIQHSTTSRRHVAPYEGDIVSSPDSECDEEESHDHLHLDTTTTISPASPTQYASLRQGDNYSLPFASRQRSDDNGLEGEGPMTPRNNAGPFVFDGGVALVANARASDNETDEPVSLNQATAA